MIYLIAFILFVFLTSMCWLVAYALYRFTFSGHKPSDFPDTIGTASVAIFLVVVTCFIPNPVGMILGTIVWMIAIFGCLSLPISRKLLLFFYLMACSVVERLTVLGVLALTA